jgi:hypothetical protein
MVPRWGGVVEEAMLEGVLVAESKGSEINVKNREPISNHNPFGAFFMTNSTS